MKCSTYASSAESIGSSSFSFEGNLLCFVLFNQAMLVSYVVSVRFINTTKRSKATNIVVCFLCAKAQKEQKMNSEC